MIDLFGRLPIHEREWIQHVIAVPGGGSAYESSAVVVFQGAVGTPSVFQHEVGHAVDAYYVRPPTMIAHKRSSHPSSFSKDPMLITKS